MASNVIELRHLLKETMQSLTSSGDPSSDDIINLVKTQWPDAVNAARKELETIAMKRILSDVSPKFSGTRWVKGSDLFGQSDGLDEIVAIRSKDGTFRRMKLGEATLGQLRVKYKTQGRKTQEDQEDASKAIESLISTLADEELSLKEALQQAKTIMSFGNQGR